MAKETGLIQGSVDRELKNQFDKWLEEKGFKVSRVVESMVKLWLTLPEDAQIRIYSGNLKEEAFIEVINQLLDKRIQAGRDAGKALSERLRKKRSQKG